MTVRIMTTLAIVALGIVQQGSGAPQDDRKEAPLVGWLFPKSTSSSVSHSENSDSPWKIDSGQFRTDAPFHEVVRFYVEKSGFIPPNWSILGREFPGDKINMPASWDRRDGSRLVTILHYIRLESANLSLLVTDFESGETVSVTVSRALSGKQVFVDVIKHSRKKEGGRR